MYIIPFLVMTCFLIGGYNILSKKELHRSPQVMMMTTTARKKERRDKDKDEGKTRIVIIQTRKGI